MFASICSASRPTPDLRAFCDYIETRGGRHGRAHGRNRARSARSAGRCEAAAYPIGVYPDEIAALAKDGESGRDVRDRQGDAASSASSIMSVDRLDYSKGLVERFRAFERLIEHRRSMAQQRVVPADRAADARRRATPTSDIRLQLEAESGRINGRYAELDWTPIRYIHRQYDRSVLAALFREAHVGFVTPLRDGMNLVAKEYVAAQDPDDPGVLVLSQFAGAARELTGR